MIEKIYIDALLAAAAYAKWDRPEVEIKAELINKRGFTDKQYETLFHPTTGIYEVYGGPSVGYIELNNGFSATIFRNVDQSSPDYDQLTVAFRGSDDYFDWLTTNLDVVFQGLGGSGALNALFGQQNVISDFLIQAGLDVGGNLTSSINFTGHSLGGFLTTIAAYKYNNSMGKAYTFNGLGIDLEDFVSNEITSSISLDGKITNYYADIVGEYIGIHPGSKIEIFIENGGLFDDHSIAKLVQSLSVYRVLATLAPDLDTDEGLGTIYHILDTTSNIPDQSLEVVINQLGELLGGNLAMQSKQEDIELFYQEVVAQGKTYLIENIQSGAIASLATQNTETGRGYRYALVNLLPFAITSNLAGTAADDPQYDAANFSKPYLADRAQMLQLMIRRNIADDTTSNSLVENLPEALYIDQKTNLKLTTGDITLAGVTNSNNSIYLGNESANATTVGIESHNGKDSSGSDPYFLLYFLLFEGDMKWA